MPVTVFWEDPEKTVVRYDFQGSWTWDELYAVYYEAIGMEKSVTHRVDVILDMSTSSRIPGNAILHVKNLAEKQPSNMGISVFVTRNPFIVSMYNMAVRVYGKVAFYFRIAKTLDEAHAMIATARQANKQPL
jgi:hypothetical protein